MFFNFTKFTIVFFLFLLLGCTKNGIEVPPKEEPPKVEPEIPKPPVSAIQKKSVSQEFNRFTVQQLYAESDYMGSLWDLKDTTKSFNLVPIKSKEKQGLMTFYSNNNFSSGISEFNPSYQNMTDYAKTFTSGSINLNFSNSDFFDYAIIEGYLDDVNDVNAIKSLVAINDSTHIRKANSIFRYLAQDDLTIFVDLTTVWEVYDANYLKVLKEQGIDPYYAAGAIYGSESVFMGETDYTKSEYIEVIDKLLKKEELDNANRAVLNASNLLIYRKDGLMKSSFIKYAKGASEIQQVIKEYNERLVRSANAVNYPLRYIFARLGDNATLRYNHKYDILIDNRKK